MSADIILNTLGTGWGMLLETKELKTKYVLLRRCHRYEASDTGVQSCRTRDAPSRGGTICKTQDATLQVELLRKRPLIRMSRKWNGME